jgi:uncharacterized C2H2 Zn-finger protein
MNIILTEVSYVCIAVIGDSWIDYHESENTTHLKQDTVQLSSSVASRCGSRLYPKDFVTLRHSDEQNVNKQHPSDRLLSVSTDSMQGLTSPILQSHQPHTKHVNMYKFPGVFPCPRCRKVYRYRTNMLRHLKVECGKEPQFQCPYCPCQTKHKSSMQRHMENRHSCK